MTTEPSNDESSIIGSPDFHQIDGHTAGENAITANDWDELCRDARAGDSDALGTLCERLRIFLSQAARDQMQRRLQSKLGASDMVQQSLIQAYRQFEQFQGSSEAEFRSWVRRILYNHTIDAARRFNETFMRDARREVSLDAGADVGGLIAPTKTASSLVRRKEIDQELLDAIGKLSARRRQVVEFRHRDSLSHAEIANRLGINEVAARQIWSRAISDLRKILTGRANVG